MELIQVIIILAAAWVFSGFVCWYLIKQSGLNSGFTGFFKKDRKKSKKL
ncbi:MAG: hypothetical protein VB100_03455 [Angelakisella sp.]|nr:hypothetical protein [Angelakisella sp.]